MASSLSPMEPLAARRTANAVWDKVTTVVRNNGLTERQRLLNWYYSFYRAQQYDNRGIDWDGSEHLSPIDADEVVQRGTVPPGFYNAGAETPDLCERPSGMRSIVPTKVTHQRRRDDAALVSV